MDSTTPPRRFPFKPSDLLQMERPTLVLIAGLVVLIVNGIVAFLATNGLIGTAREANRTRELQVAVQRTLSLVTDVETGARGFALTSFSSYLEPYEAAKNQLGDHLAELRTLAESEPQHAFLLDKLEPQIAAKLVYSDSLIAIRRDSTLEAVESFAQAGRGKALMDSVRATVLAMQELSEIRGNDRTTTADRLARRSLVTITVFALLSLLLLAMVQILSRRDVQKREEIARLLQIANDELETRVRERTAALTLSNRQLTAEVSVRESAEARLRDANAELTRSNRELQDFAFVASHDLQEPLRKIQTFSSLLEEEYADRVDPEVHAYLERIAESANRMSRLISDLLAFSRVTSKAQPFIMVELDQVAAEVLSTLEIAIQESEGTVDVGSLPAVEADEFQMRQVFQNLIGNALKFRHPDRAPLVSVRGERVNPGSPHETVVLTFSDNGIGFDEKYLDKIFTPFQRLHDKSKYDGTGIGLSICRRIVERHGGTITAQSTPEAGSTFVITLPVHHPEGVLTPAEAATT